MEKYSVDVERDAVHQVLKNMGFKPPYYTILVGGRTYRHTTSTGTEREFRVFNTNEYFDAVKKGVVSPQQKLHRAMTKYIVERVTKKNGVPVEETPLFYTVDPEYVKYNNQSYEVVTESPNGICCEIRLECGDTIIAFLDEKNGFIRKHENDPIRIPVTWEVCGYVNFHAGTIREALDEFWEKKDELPLPTDSTYIDDSFELSSEEEGIIAAYNHPFRNPDRKRTMEVPKREA